MRCVSVERRRTLRAAGHGPEAAVHSHGDRCRRTRGWPGHGPLEEARSGVSRPRSAGGRFHDGREPSWAAPGRSVRNLHTEQGLPLPLQPGGSLHAERRSLREGGDGVRAAHHRGGAVGNRLRLALLGRPRERARSLSPPVPTGRRAVSDQRGVPRRRLRNVLLERPRDGFPRPPVRPGRRRAQRVRRSGLHAAARWVPGSRESRASDGDESSVRDHSEAAEGRSGVQGLRSDQLHHDPLGLPSEHHREDAAGVSRSLPRPAPPGRRRAIRAAPDPPRPSQLAAPAELPRSCEAARALGRRRARSRARPRVLLQGLRLPARPVLRALPRLDPRRRPLRPERDRLHGRSR